MKRDKLKTKRENKDGGGGRKIMMEEAQEKNGRDSDRKTRLVRYLTLLIFHIISFTEMRECVRVLLASLHSGL